MSRFIFTRLAQLVVLSAGLFSTMTTYAGVAGCTGVICNSTAPTCCSVGSICCTNSQVPYCSDPGDC